MATVAIPGMGSNYRSHPPEVFNGSAIEPVLDLGRKIFSCKVKYNVGVRFKTRMGVVVLVSKK
jgi:hypothetical protein